MLYVNTKDRVNAFTSNGVLLKGGEDHYLPYQVPIFSAEQITALHQKDISQRIADILNLFYRSNLNSWDVAFAVGKYPIRIAAMPYRMAILETWHNPKGAFDGFVSSLYRMLCLGKDLPDKPCQWFRISARIAVLFAAFGELMKTGIAGIHKPIDIVLSAKEFEAVLAAWLARKMGLPIGSIILSCDESDGFWDFFHYGQLKINRKGSGKEIAYKAWNDLEMLIYATLGFYEAERFAAAIKGGEAYTIREDQLAVLRKDIFCTVIRQERVNEVISNFFKTNAYLMSADTAAAYAGLRDYRAALGETGAMLMLSDRMPGSTT